MEQWKKVFQVAKTGLFGPVTNFFVVDATGHLPGCCGVYALMGQSCLMGDLHERADSFNVGADWSNVAARKKVLHHNLPVMSVNYPVFILNSGAGWFKSQCSLGAVIRNTSVKQSDSDSSTSVLIHF